MKKGYMQEVIEVIQWHGRFVRKIPKIQYVEKIHIMVIEEIPIMVMQTLLIPMIWRQC